jgi:glycosyltransferase involved in cell wall biosynthesis
MAERPRVLFLGPDVPGGMGTSIAALLASPLAERYRIEVVATHRGTDPVQRLVVFLAALWRLTWWSLSGRGRLVHVHSTVRGSMYRKAVCVLWAKALRRRVVLHMHSGPGDIATFRAGLAGLRLAFLRRAFLAADRVLSVSEASAVALRESFGERPVLVLPNPAPPRPAVDRSGRSGEPLIVFIGGFANPVKGGETLLEALARPEAAALRVALAGPGDLPAAGAELVAARPGFGWRGWLEPAARDELLAAADVFVLPSTSEGLPMAMLEAMSWGLAIVATAVGGVPDVATDGEDAIVVAPGEPELLAAGIVALAADPERRRRLGRAARARAEELSPEKVAARLEDVYAGLVGGPT